MPQPLRLYTDGARNHNTKEVGWAYVLVHGETVLLADSGTTFGSATDGEYFAVIQGLLALPRGTRVRLVTDREDVGFILNDGWEGKTNKKRITKLRRLIRRLGDPHEVTCSVIPSGSHPMHRAADTLSRRACGLKSKSQMRSAQKKRAKAKKEMLETFATWHG